MDKRLTRISTRVYVVRSGSKVFVIEEAKFVLRRAGRFLQHWLKYVSGVLSTTGERIWVCLGEALRADIEAWVHSSNGQDTMFVLRLLEYMVRKLGLAKCLAIATIALREEEFCG